MVLFLNNNSYKVFFVKLTKQNKCHMASLNSVIFDTLFVSSFWLMLTFMVLNHLLELLVQVDRLQKVSFVHYLQCTLVIVNAWIVNNLSLVNKIGDKTDFTITKVHCTQSIPQTVFSHLKHSHTVFFYNYENPKKGHLPILLSRLARDS